MGQGGEGRGIVSLDQVADGQGSGRGRFLELEPLGAVGLRQLDGGGSLVGVQVRLDPQSVMREIGAGVYDYLADFDLSSEIDGQGSFRIPVDTPAGIRPVAMSVVGFDAVDGIAGFERGFAPCLDIRVGVGKSALLA